MWNNKAFSVLGMQLACVGLALVAGFFFLWRILSRLEEKVARLCDSMKELQSAGGAGMCAFDPTETLHALLGGHGRAAHEGEGEGEVEGESDDGMMIFTQLNVEPPEPPKEAVVQVVEEDAAKPAAAAPPPSKSKLQRMNAEELRALAEQTGISTEGTRAEIIERLMA
jgi:hypothetical protein